MDGGFGGFGAFVAETASGAVEGLLLVVDGEHAEYYRAFGVEVELGESVGDCAAYVVEVGCVAPDYAAYYYHCVEEWLKACCGVGQFDCAGHVE